jgi:hypothetical protein
MGARGGHGDGHGGGHAADIWRKLNVSQGIEMLKNGVSVSSSSRCGAVRYRLAHSYYPQPYTYLLAYLLIYLPAYEATCAAGVCTSSWHAQLSAEGKFVQVLYRRYRSHSLRLFRQPGDVFAPGRDQIPPSP